jgi:putative transposase
MSIVTYQFRIKDSTSGVHLTRMAHAVNYVWNFCNEVSMLALQREHKWFSAFDLINLTAGASKDLGIHSDTISEVCREYATKRRAARKRKLKWRSQKRSLGWVPFKGRCVKVDGDTVTYAGHTFRFWLSRPIQGTIKTGGFTQDARKRWYVHFQCEVDDPGIPVGHTEIGIDLGCTDQIACSDLEEPYSRPNLTRQYAEPLAIAQREHHRKRVKAIHAKMANTRKDWIHKVTTAIVLRACFLAIGDVSSTKLAQTRMAKSIYDAGWGLIRVCLRYKAMRLGILVTEPHEARSTITCADCLHETGPRGLSGLRIRVWTCAHCGAVHNRDLNSAKFILHLGRQMP